MNYDQEIIRWYDKETTDLNEASNPIAYHSRNLNYLFNQGKNLGKQKTPESRQSYKRFKQKSYKLSSLS